MCICVSTLQTLVTYACAAIECSQCALTRSQLIDPRVQPVASSSQWSQSIGATAHQLDRVGVSVTARDPFIQPSVDWLFSVQFNLENTHAVTCNHFCFCFCKRIYLLWAHKPQKISFAGIRIYIGKCWPTDYTTLLAYISDKYQFFFVDAENTILKLTQFTRDLWVCGIRGMLSEWVAAYSIRFSAILIFCIFIWINYRYYYYYYLIILLFMASFWHRHQTILSARRRPSPHLFVIESVGMRCQWQFDFIFMYSRLMYADSSHTMLFKISFYFLSILFVWMKCACGKTVDRRTNVYECSNAFFALQ